MIVNVIHRFAYFISLLAGMFGCKFIMPDDASWWANLAVVSIISGPIYYLLYKRGVTDRQPNRRSKQR